MAFWMQCALYAAAYASASDLPMAIGKKELIVVSLPSTSLTKMDFFPKHNEESQPGFIRCTKVFNMQPYL
jgi:hypothetical protein